MASRPAATVAAEPARATDAGVDAGAAWAAVVEAIRAEQPMKQVGLTDAKVLGLSNGVLRLAVADAFLQLAASRRELVERIWQRVTETPIRVEFVGGGGSPRPAAPDARQGARPHGSAQPVRAFRGQRDAAPPPPDEPPPPPDDSEAESEGTRHGGSAGEHPSTAARPLGAPSPAATRREGSEAAFRKALTLFEGAPLE